MEIKETIVDRFGRIVIPKKIVLKPVRGEPNLHWKDGVLVFTGSALGNLNEALAKHREDRERNILKP
jgi:bifunctional DNA-binding transcriptional regulator/antitoxin component of YhaV-PrlF toxin-antitoxin module